MMSLKNLSLRLSRENLVRLTSLQNEKYCTKPKSSSKIPKNLLKDLYSANHQEINGVIYDKKPFKVRLEAGKKYSWCFCGRSHSQPLCDGTHRDIFLKIKQRPIRFEVEETKDYWLCNCKQTKNRPFCDGTHKRQDIQDTNVKV